MMISFRKKFQYIFNFFSKTVFHCFIRSLVKNSKKIYNERDQINSNFLEIYKIYFFDLLASYYFLIIFLSLS